MEAIQIIRACAKRIAENPEVRVHFSIWLHYIYNIGYAVMNVICISVLSSLAVLALGCDMLQHYYVVIQKCCGAISLCLPELKVLLSKASCYSTIYIAGG